MAKCFNEAEKYYCSLARICDLETLVVQMVAFADPVRQLPQYLAMLDSAGFREVYVNGMATEPIPEAQERLWRKVPNRKWYASQRGSIGASKEVVLFHRLAG